MAFSVDLRTEIMNNLASIRINLINPLCQAVEREAIIRQTPKYDAKQGILTNSLRGLSVLYYFAFLQSHVEKAQWKGIKDQKGIERKNFKTVNWDHFDSFKYVRDCFGHNWEGSLFPITQDNTKQFLAIQKVGMFPASVSLMNDKIILRTYP